MLGTYLKGDRKTYKLFENNYGHILSANRIANNNNLSKTVDSSIFCLLKVTATKGVA